MLFRFLTVIEEAVPPFLIIDVFVFFFFISY